MNEPPATAEGSTARHRGPRQRARSAQMSQAVAPQRAPSPEERSVHVGEGGTEKIPRGYRVDYGKLKTLSRQAGLKIIDLYEPGVIPRQLISEGTIKKWRRGGRGTSESPVKIASALSSRLGWQVDWRELTQVENASVAVSCRVAILPVRVPRLVSEWDQVARVLPERRSDYRQADDPSGVADRPY